MKLTSHLRHNAVAYLALFFSLSGTAYAATAIHSGDIVDGEVKAVDLGTLPHIVVGDNGPEQAFTVGQDSAVRFGGANLSRSNVSKHTNSTRFEVIQSGLYAITAHVRLNVHVICNNPGDCAGYANAKIVRYAGGGSTATPLATDQAKLEMERPNVYDKQVDLVPVVVARLQAGDEVAVMVAADMTSGNRQVVSPFKLPTETAAMQPLFTMHFVGK